MLKSDRLCRLCGCSTPELSCPSTVPGDPDTGRGSFSFLDHFNSLGNVVYHPSFPYGVMAAVTPVGKVEIRCQLCFIPESSSSYFRTYFFLLGSVDSVISV